MVKRSRENSNRKKQRNSSTLLWQKTVYLTVLLQKVFEKTTRSNPASMTVASHGIPHDIEDSWPADPQRRLPLLSSLSDYFKCFTVSNVTFFLQLFYWTWFFHTLIGIPNLERKKLIKYFKIYVKILWKKIFIKEILLILLIRFLKNIINNSKK